jgi:ribosomal protein S14
LLSRLASPDSDAMSAQSSRKRRTRQCHSSGTRTSGLLNNGFVLDHQPAVRLAWPGAVFRGYPQCANCGLIRPGGTSQPFQVRKIVTR